MSKQDYRTLDQVEEEFLRDNPAELDNYIRDLFEDYAAHKSAPALLASLRVVAKVKGMSNIANEIGMTREGLYKALSAKGNPRFDNINALMQSFGYHLMPQKIDGPA
jgi:probable addiction module antidote protein